ncbi:MAG: TVP38/TMEM64 family protein [Clostridia bacterium]|nr:TVP38/TMEM64 family protein [Clostridia bacterium]
MQYKNNLKTVCFTVLNIIFGILSIVLFLLFLEKYDSGFLFNNKTLISSITVSVITAITILSVLLLFLDKEVLYKLFFIVSISVLFVIFLLFLFKITGLFDKIDSIEDLRSYISSFNGVSAIIFILIQFLQVVLLPIPSFITIGAGVILFGAFKSAVYSCIGIISGSIVAFIVGRIFGYKVATWIVGKKPLDKWLKSIKGKDKVILTFMFLLPFFPDDVLCFVAGLTTISFSFYIVMIFLTRITGVFVACYSINNSLIPYNTWWGIIIWCIIIFLLVTASIYISKHSDEIKIFKKRKR